ncbi:MAG: ATP-dependent zinc protease [Alphaproteobacteria bacterium]|nr:ATP-dependent zinc protease [Alphaproteobacteria bacterium]
MKKATVLGILMMLTACATAPTPKIDDNTESKQPTKIVNQLPTIGGVERLYVENIKAPFHARIDTGAETSSIDVQNITPFERDGEKWVSFDLVNRSNGEKIKLEKPIKRKTTIKRTNDAEHRYVVRMKIRMGKSLINADFTLNDRSKFDYQVLIGRNIISGRYIVDVSTTNTLR